MRRAYSDFSIIKDGDTFYGISLGYDFCAEHEWGIEDMRRNLGIGKDSKNLSLIDKLKEKLRIGKNPDNLGLANRLVTKGETVIFKKNKNNALLTSCLPYGKNAQEATLEDLIPHDLSRSNLNKELSTAWDGKQFCIIVSGEQNIANLEDLYNQFQKNNVAITRINSDLPAFSNASLCILVADRIPQESLDDMYMVDKSAKDLVDYEEKIGLTKLKEKTRNGYKKEKYYCACSPRWINYLDAEARQKEKEKIGTKYDITYWINYSDDDDNYGHYTVEEIEKWLSTPGLKLTQIRNALAKKSS